MKTKERKQKNRQHEKKPKGSVFTFAGHLLTEKTRLDWPAKTELHFPLNIHKK